MKKKLLSLLMAISLIFTVSCKQAVGGVESSISEVGQIKNIKITADKANILSGCSDNAQVLQTSSKNNKLNVLNEVEDWYAVKLPDNKIGFVPKQQCQPIVVDDKKAGAPSNAPEANAPQETTPQESAPQGTTTTKTPTAKTNAASLTTAEAEMLKLVNEARAQNNVPALKIDMELSNVARIKSQDMIDNNYFSHYSPKYGSPFDMMKSFNINFVKAGENIAGNQNVANAHNSLMNSPGHRKNILDPSYTHIGIGIKKGGTYENMFTQMFISKPQ
jgi:uncharacterized YkwD family protein